MRLLVLSAACLLFIATLAAPASAGKSGDDKLGEAQIKRFDKDGSKGLEGKEFVNFLRFISKQTKAPSKADIKSAFRQIDTDTSRSVSADEINVWGDKLAKDNAERSKKEEPKEQKPNKKKVKAQRDLLQAYYRKYAPEKTIADVDATIKKRAGKSGWFEAMNAKLGKKYGETPKAFAKAAKGKKGEAAPEGVKKGKKKKEAPKKKNKSNKVPTNGMGDPEDITVKALHMSRRKTLVAFYKKYVPDKTAADVDGIMTKRAGRGAGWYDELCAKLAKKYGENPNKMKEEPAEEEEEEEEKKETKKDKKKENMDKKKEYMKKKKEKARKAKSKEKLDKTNKMKDSKKGKKGKKGPDDDSDSDTSTDDLLDELRLKVLTHFMKVHAPDKTQSKIDETVAKSKEKLGDKWWKKLCASMVTKYGEDPVAYWKKTAAERAADEFVSKNSGDFGADDAPAPAKPSHSDEKAAAEASALSALVGKLQNVTRIARLTELAETLLEEEAAAIEEARLEQEKKDKEAAELAEQKKKAARARLKKLKAEAAKKAAEKEAEEEKKMELEDYTPPDLTQEDNIVTVEGETVLWIEDAGLGQYTATITRYGGSLVELSRRLKVEVMEGFGMKTTELTKLKKALKKLRKKLRADSKKRVASEAKAEAEVEAEGVEEEEAKKKDTDTAEEKTEDEKEE